MQEVVTEEAGGVVKVHDWGSMPMYITSMFCFSGTV